MHQKRLKKSNIENLKHTQTHLITTPEGSNNTIVAEPMQALFRGHCFFQHVQTNWTHEFAVQTTWTDGYLGVVGYSFLGYPVHLVKRQIPGFVLSDLFGRRHVLQNNKHFSQTYTRDCIEREVVFWRDALPAAY